MNLQGTRTLGAVVSTQFRPTQVAVVGPLLRHEALRAQRARIDIVSGATYTSDACAQSLQSALDRAAGAAG